MQRAPVRRAYEIENAIEEAIARDQGARFRGFERHTMAALDDAYRDEQEDFRSHMGASLMGGKCGRAIWYSFRWATKSNFSGRMQRLFNRGHLEEGRFIAMLLTIGAHVVQVDPATGKQYRITGSSGHYGGSGDGVACRLPGLDPNTWAVTEFKTHNEKSFLNLVKEGVRGAKFEHWVQMQQYMRKMGLTVALYMAVNKNTDELYCEWVVLEHEPADMFIDRADKIIWMNRAPERIGSPPSPGNWDCKFCDHKPVCFQKAKPAVNCRSCVHAEPVVSAESTGVWYCNKWFGNIPKSGQLVGCQHWTQHPDMGT